MESTDTSLGAGGAIFMVLWLGFWIGCTVWGAKLAIKKGRSGWLGGFLGWFLGLIGVAIVAWGLKPAESNHGPLVTTQSEPDPVVRILPRP